MVLSECQRTFNVIITTYSYLSIYKYYSYIHVLLTSLFMIWIALPCNVFYSLIIIFYFIIQFNCVYLALPCIFFNFVIQFNFFNIITYQVNPLQIPSTRTFYLDHFLNYFHFYFTHMCTIIYFINILVFIHYI